MYKRLRRVGAGVAVTFKSVYKLQLRGRKLFWRQILGGVEIAHGSVCLTLQQPLDYLRV